MESPWGSTLLPPRPTPQIKDANSTLSPRQAANGDLTSCLSQVAARPPGGGGIVGHLKMERLGDLHTLYPDGPPSPLNALAGALGTCSYTPQPYPLTAAPLHTVRAVMCGRHYISSLDILTPPVSPTLRDLQPPQF